MVKAMLDGAYDNYWISTMAYESLKGYISLNFDGLRDSVVWMLAGGRCQVNTDTFSNDMTSFKGRDDVLTILIHPGYPAYDRDAKEVYIPNEEVRAAFANVVKETDWTPVIQAMEQSEALLKATWKKDADAVAQGIGQVHMAGLPRVRFLRLKRNSIRKP